MPSHFYGELNNYRALPRTLRGHKSTGITSALSTRTHEIKTSLYAATRGPDRDYISISVRENHTGKISYLYRGRLDEFLEALPMIAKVASELTEGE